MVGERLSSSGTCLNVSSPVQSTVAGGVPHKSSAESVHRVLKSVSRQSLLGNYPLPHQFHTIYIKRLPKPSSFTQ